ncbi:MAG: hypothetical protein LBV22_01415 [Mycoplasmataceae bacterium]|jgi:hypothetical protein|nr:hypothetical protein [Mycoplasmataceae bacterium]
MIEFISTQKHGTIIIEQNCVVNVVKNIVKQVIGVSFDEIKIGYVGHDIAIEVVLNAKSLNNSVAIINSSSVTIKNSIVKSLNLDNLILVLRLDN